MKEEAVEAIVQGLKEAGINFVALMADSEFSAVQRELLKLTDVKCIQITNEAVGTAICAGAWLGGKVPALLVPTAGLLVACWPLASVCYNWGVPTVVVIPYRGDVGDGHWVMKTYQYTTEPALKMLQIPYSIVAKVSEVKEAMKAARKSAAGWLHPVAVLLTGEVIW